MATSYVTSKGKPLEFRVKIGDKISDDGHCSVIEHILCRRISKVKWRIVLTLELDQDKSTKAEIDLLYRHKTELRLLVHCNCANKEVSVSQYWECTNEGWDWYASNAVPNEQEWDVEPLELMSKNDQANLAK